ncbi:MAG TPA: hypothetical protein VJK71_11330 [Gemmatimonadales bacterium]|nr:hypothetical protein [Gemmatimonadales bacterium]
MLQMLDVSDVSGQKRMTVDEFADGATVGELVDRLLAELDLVREDGEGRPLSYHARLEREGRHLHAAERVGDALQSGDQLVLQPNIDAGAGDR